VISKSHVHKLLKIKLLQNSLDGRLSRSWHFCARGRRRIRDRWAIEHEDITDGGNAAIGRFAFTGGNTGSNPVRVAKHTFPRKAASIKDLEFPKPVPFRLSGIPNRGQKRPNRPSWNVYYNKVEAMLLPKNLTLCSTSRPIFSRVASTKWRRAPRKLAKR